MTPIVIMIGQLGFVYDGVTLYCRAFISNRDAPKQTWNDHLARERRQAAIDRARAKVKA
jgi:hypothetical protein